LTKADIDKTLAWHNQPAIKDLYSSHPFPVNREMEARWYENILYSNFPTTVLGVEHIEDGVLIGIVLLKGIHQIHRHCEFAIYLGEEAYKGRGLSKEATREALSFAFNQLGLQRVYLHVLEHNEIALKLYQRLGFQQEGVLRQHVYKNGAFRNELILSMLRAEFDA
jgi:RimJ/RimL family protein N-acetyltransferase